MKAKTFRIITFSVVGFLLALVIAVNVAAGIWGDLLIGLLSGGDLDSETRAKGESLAEQIVEEGTVLVKNDDNVLPLEASDPANMKVNVFGWSSVNWVPTGSGSGRSTNDGNEEFDEIEVDFLKALDLAGVQYNNELTNFYKDTEKRDGAAWDTLHHFESESCYLYEPTVSDELMTNAKSYSDIAIVVLSRVSGESSDAPLVQYKRVGSNPALAVTDLTYLDASSEERELLERVGENFGKVIVLINSTNQMNLNFLRDIAGLDACLVAGGTGNVGTTGIVNLLYGQGMYQGENEKHTPYGDPVSPSGRLADTYAYDFRTNSSWANTGNLGVGKYSGADGLYPIDVGNGNYPSGTTYTQVSYLDYVEGIYVGYKWYETADKEGFWDSERARTLFGIQNGYQDVVQFPFGYGLTYTEFSWEVTEVPSATDISLLNVDDELQFKVKVTNTGDFPAQDVVELYYTPPYTKGEIEKSAVNLLAFAKTRVLEHNDSEELTLTFSPADMGSYDAYGKKIKGGSGWILEAGNYELTLRTDAHTVADMSDATFTMNVASNLERYDAEQAYNLFTGDDAIDYGISLDGENTGANITYLSRANFVDTFPTVLDNTDRTQSTKTRAMDQRLKNTNLYLSSDATSWDAQKKAEAEQKGMPITMPTLNALNGLTIFEEAGETAGLAPNDLGVSLGMDYYDPLWDDVLDQLSYSEMSKLALHGWQHEEPVRSVGKTEITYSYDGPSQVASFKKSKGVGTGYPNPSILAQTWNSELALDFGLSAGTEVITIGYRGWYAPGMNLHRSAFGGRNYEYFSEDSSLTGIMAARVAEGALTAGAYVYAKHIIGYDQETARDSLYCWMTEQTLRETYLKPFKIMLDEVKERVEGTPGLMTSYGRLGAVWSGGSEALIASLLRDEWGYNGAILSDYADHQDFMNGDQMIRAGGDLWMDGGTAGHFRSEFGSTEDNPVFVNQLREAAHHVLYTMCNAKYVKTVYNVEGSDGNGIQRFPLWTIIGVADGVIIAGCAVWVFFAIRKKDKAAESEPDETAEEGEIIDASEPKAKTSSVAEEPTADPNEGRE